MMKQKALFRVSVKTQLAILAILDDVLLNAFFNGKKERGFSARYQRTMDKRIERMINNVLCYSIKLKISPAIYAQRAAMVLRTNNDRVLNPFAIGSDRVYAALCKNLDVKQQENKKARRNAVAVSDRLTEYDYVLQSIRLTCAKLDVFTRSLKRAMTAEEITAFLLGVRALADVVLLYDFRPLHLTWRLLDRKNANAFGMSLAAAKLRHAEICKRYLHKLAITSELKAWFCAVGETHSEFAKRLAAQKGNHEWEQTQDRTHKPSQEPTARNSSE